MDTTTYYAMKNEQRDKVHPGGVYFVYKQNGSIENDLVIARDDRVALILRMLTDSSVANYEVYDGWSTNVLMPGYAFVSNIGELMFDVPDDDFRRLRDEMAAKCGFAETVVVEKEVERKSFSDTAEVEYDGNVIDYIKNMRDHVKRLQCEMSYYQGKLDEIKEALG